MDVTVYYTETLNKTLGTTEEDIREHVAANAKDYAADPLPDRQEDESEEDFSERFCDWVSENTLLLSSLDAQAEIESEEIDVTEVEAS